MPTKLYGLLAEFKTADELLTAARAARAQGYQRIEAYSPFPVEGLDEAVGMGGNRVALGALLGGVAGGVGTYFMQWYSAVLDYPINVGGRPLHSWPVFLLVPFEVAVFAAALAGVIAMVRACGLPRLHPPVFAVAGFERASQDRCFLLAET